MNNDLKYVALFPMKRNSARIKGKNFREFEGKPLFEWMLSKLVASQRISKVVINTDATDILSRFEICDNPRVVLRKRIKSIQGDLISMNRILEDDIKACGENKYLMTHTTNPLISLSTIHGAMDQFELMSDQGYDSLFSCNEHKSRFYDERLRPINHDPENLIPTQDLSPIYEENSCLYIFTNSSFHGTNARIGKNPYIYVTPPLESIDIDQPVNWTQAVNNFRILSQ